MAAASKVSICTDLTREEKQTKSLTWTSSWVLDHFDRYAQEVDKTSGLASNLSLKYGIFISEVFIREVEWLAGDTPFLLNAREEAIRV